MKERLARRFRWLRNWELFNVFFLPALLLFYWRQSPLPGNWSLRFYAMFIICYILVQGTIYWHLKVDSIRRRPYHLPPWFAGRFQWLRRSIYLLVGLYPVLAVFLLAFNHTSVADLLWSLPLLLFAGLEYINYYHYQLMHDTRSDLSYLARHRRLRRAPLATDLDRAGDAAP